MELDKLENRIQNSDTPYKSAMLSMLEDIIGNICWIEDKLDEREPEEVER